MKRIAVFLACLFFLTGCKNVHLERSLSLREQLLSSAGCTYIAVITADYGEEIYQFKMDCIFDETGNMKFTVMEPLSIAGITGTISDEKGTIDFDDEVLSFDLLTDDTLSPVSAPWILMRALRSGYIAASGKDGDGFQVIYDDSYQSDALQVITRTDNIGNPVTADILWKNRRICSVSIDSFQIL